MMFLPSQLIMIDLEMTGVNPDTDDVLQIAMLQLELDEKHKAYKATKSLNAFLKHKGSPTRDFDKKYLSHVYKRCNKSPLTPKAFKRTMHDWLGDLKGKVTPTGDCVPCDVEFLYRSGCADRNYFDENDNSVEGSFHYEFFEINPLKIIAREILGEKDLVEKPHQEHDALGDCRNQLLELNKCLSILFGVGK